MISDSELERRLKAVETRLNVRYAARPGGPMLVVLFYGGLMPEPIVATTDNGGEWFRDYPDETVEAFADRCGKAAAEMGAARMLITSMPQGERQCEVVSAAHAIYMRDFYPEVPEEEATALRVSPLRRVMDR
jgi:hypothetical protein